MSESTPVKQRVLVIDDNRAIHDDLKKALCNRAASSSLDALESEIFGGQTAAAAAVAAIEYDVDSAFQGEEGVAKVVAARQAGAPYMMAFVDMRMPPGIDGVDTIERLWREDPDVQVVVCTAYSDYSWDEMVDRLGLTDRMLVIKKPFDQAEVCQAAAAMCEKWRLTQQVKLQLDDLQQMVDHRTSELRQTNQRLEHEIAERQAAQDRLRHEALHDPLTNLPNRSMLMERMDRCIRRTQREPGTRFAVVFLDLDNFKVINDSLGHGAGDEVLLTVASRLQACVRSVDSVGRQETTARLGGDEFVVLLDNLKSPTDAIVVADRISEQLAQPLELAGSQVVLSASVGIAVSSGEYQSSEDMLRDADIAMYRAKSLGKAKYAVFNREMHEDAMGRLELETDLRSAIDHQQFHLMYQPIVKLETGEMEGVEALLRWDRPRFGTVLPAGFIGVAEERGLIVPIGIWVMEQACRQLSDWRKRIPRANQITMSVNLSKRQIAEPGLVEHVERILRENELDGSALNLEVTESGIMENSTAIADVLARLKGIGCSLHMDDFGTGYSSLSCLHTYPLDVLKVDRSFLNTMSANRDYAAVVYTIMALAHNLKMKVTAEGVETPEQVALLQALECDYVQGHYFARPLSVGDTESLLRAGASWQQNRRSA
jgi:diguanylate cyclase (GGDEF)-like protein